MTGPMRDGAPVRCDEHGGRPECTRQTKRGTGRCHGLAIEGLDVCRMHVGVSGEAAKAKGQAALARQRFRDVSPAEYVHPGDVLAWAVTVAFIDLVDFRAGLRDQAKTGALDPADLDRLARMQLEVARVSKMALDANVDERQIRLAEKTAEQLVAVLRGVVTELGHDANDPMVQSVLHRQLALVAGEPAA